MRFFCRTLNSVINLSSMPMSSNTSMCVTVASITQVTRWWPPAATSSHSLHCLPPSAARAFSCLIHCQGLLSLNHLPANVSILSQQVTRNVLHLPPSGFMPCPSNVGEVHPTEMRGGSTRRKVLAWTYGGNLAFFFTLCLSGEA